MNGTPDRIRSHARPVHPPFTDFPLAAYVFAAGFDVVSAIDGGQHRWATQLWHAGTFVLVGGLAICLITMGTGFWDLVRFPPGSPEVVRTIAIHVCVMGAVFMMGTADIAWRLSEYDSAASTPPGLVALSLTTAIVACTGAFFGGKLVFGHGIGVAAAVRTPSQPYQSYNAAYPELPEEPAADGHGQAADGQSADGQAADGQAAPTPVRQPPTRPDKLA